MKKLSLSVLTGACTLALTACGGGGGGSTPVTTPTIIVPTITTPTTDTANSGNSANANANANNSNASANANANSANANANSANSNSTADTNKKPTTPIDGNVSDAAKAPTAKTNVEKLGTMPTGSVSAAFAKTGFNDMATYSIRNDKNLPTDTGYNEFSKLYDGIHVKIDNKTGTATATKTPSTLGFQDFEFDGIHMVFLGRASDLRHIATRKINSGDFPDGNYNPKDANNPGYMGSYYSPINSHRDLGPFGRLRYGVYTDSNNISHLFVHGTPTTRAFAGTYRGSAIMGKNGDYKAYDKAVTAVVSPEVDKIDISIVTDKTTLNFGGGVNSSTRTFEGTKNGINTRGGFFGSDLGGVFEVTQGVHAGENGVFGAADTKTDADFRELYK